MPTFREDTKIGGMVPIMKTDDINDQAITKDKIRDGNVTAEKLADGAVSTDKLPDGAIKTPKIADENITTGKLAEASVVTSKIADQNVTKEKIADQSVDSSKLSPAAVTYDKLKDKSVITEKLNDRAVTTEKIEEKAVTNPKLGDQSVDGRVVREASIEDRHIGNNAVTTPKIASRSVTREKIAYNSVSRAELTPDVRTSIDKKADAEQVNNSLYDLEKKIGERFVVEGDVTNLPDEEDLTSVKESERDVLKLADRSYAPEKFSGKGYKILRRNIKPVSIAVTKIQIESVPSADGTLSFTINGKETQVTVSATTENTTVLVAQKVASVLQESMTEYEVLADASTITLTRKFGGSITPSVFSASTTSVACTVTDSTKREFRNLLTTSALSEANTIYEIRYNFDLNGGTVEMKEGCTLKFEGGSLTNGTLSGNVLMCGYGHTDCNITKCEIDFDASLYITCDNKENTAELQRVLNIAGNISGKVYFSKTLDIYYSNKVCVLSNSIIDFKNVTLIQHGLKSTFMNIGNSKETYDDENIQLYNITARSYEQAAKGRVFWFEGVRNLIIENFNYEDNYALETESGNHAAWAITISGYNITLRNIIINNYKGGIWYDGIHFEFVDNVLLDGFQIASGDDCIAIHPQWNPPFDKNINIPNYVKNITVQNGHGKSLMANLIRIGYSNLSENNISFYIKDVLYNNIVQEKGKRSNIIETMRESRYNISDITFKNITGISSRNDSTRCHIDYNDNTILKDCIFDLGDSNFVFKSKHLKIDNCMFTAKSSTKYNEIDSGYLDVYKCRFVTSNGIQMGNNFSEQDSYINFMNNLCNIHSIIIGKVNKVNILSNYFDLSTDKESFNIVNVSEFKMLYNSVFFKSNVFISSSIRKDDNNKLYFIGNFINNNSVKVQYLISVFTDIKYKYGCFLNNIINITNTDYSVKKFAETVDYDDSLPYEFDTAIPSTSLNNCKIKKKGTKPYIYLDNTWKEISIVN